ncbi:helix-turn-helix domain-containing protein [Streptomyces sp. C11-1]|uniref:Helix-turn-helix domain-containing protein n=1 Tax=Streptomyces durocortorensis TaxID=2811104 RepID=A0ABY9W4K9_9ACTN|nr:helix-turn-helix domain-containing protein [Streptomyces durocortorensis]WNF31100.1 helix-turn-helix domain-containing protein [Streptomyces durocortorensis]
MLRVHFSDADLGRTQVAAAPDPLWEIATSLHRFQVRDGRWAYAQWHRSVRAHLGEKGLERAFRTVLLPLFPRAAYFPDFLTPVQAGQGLDAGLDAILATPPRRILEEVAILDRVVGAPSWAPRLAETQTRLELVRVLRAYHEVAIAPYSEHIQAHIDAERSARCRGLLDGGVEGMLAGLSSTMRWQRPVLHVEYPPEDRDLWLGGRGIKLVPSYFSWRAPTSLADPGLPPVLCYPVLREPPAPPPDTEGPAAAPLTALLGRARAAALCAVAAGATTGEIARAAGVSASSASRHATALRDAGLITSSRHAATVLHTLTPVGASVLRAGTRTAEA